jgi:hypothetical protein
MFSLDHGLARDRFVITNGQRAAVHIIYTNLTPLQGPPDQRNSVARGGFGQNVADVIIYSAFADI